MKIKNLHFLDGSKKKLTAILLTGCIFITGEFLVQETKSNDESNYSLTAAYAEEVDVKIKGKVYITSNDAVIQSYSDGSRTYNCKIGDSFDYVDYEDGGYILYKNGKYGYVSDKYVSKYSGYNIFLVNECTISSNKDGSGKIWKCKKNMEFTCIGQDNGVSKLVNSNGEIGYTDSKNVSKYKIIGDAYIVSDNVPVYKSSNTNGGIYRYYEKGQSFPYINFKNGWYTVYNPSNGCVGYIPSNYVLPFKEYSYIYIANDNTVVYKGSTTSSKSYCTYDKGTCLICSKHANGWYEVFNPSNGFYGYVQEKNVSENKVENIEEDYSSQVKGSIYSLYTGSYVMDSPADNGKRIYRCVRLQELKYIDYNDEWYKVYRQSDNMIGYIRKRYVSTYKNEGFCYKIKGSGYITNDGGKIYCLPSKESNVVRTCKKGEVYFYIGANSEWYEVVNTNGEIYYIQNDSFTLEKNIDYSNIEIGKVYVTSETANIYSNTSNGDILMVAKKGNKFTYVNHKDGYFELYNSSNGEIGYIKDSESSIVGNKNNDCLFTAVVKVNSLNVYASNNDDNAIDTLNRYVIVEVLSNKGSWSKIRYGNGTNGSKTGWVMNNNLSKVTGRYIALDIGGQTLYVIDDGEIIFNCSVITGNKDVTPTPVGIRYIQNLKENYVMTGYNKDGSRYTAYVTTALGIGDGYYFHDIANANFITNSSAYLTGKGSHGCIRMSKKNVERLRKLVPRGKKVYLYDTNSNN